MKLQRGQGVFYNRYEILFQFSIKIVILLKESHLQPLRKACKTVNGKAQGLLYILRRGSLRKGNRKGFKML